MFILNDESIHRYMYDELQKCIFFIIEEKGNEKKYITLCDNIDACEFILKDNNTVKTKIKNKKILYNNNFKIDI